MVPDLAEAVARYERSADGSVRWGWSCAAEHYPALLRAGVRIGRCHDVALAERLLLGREGRGGEPASLGGGGRGAGGQGALFEGPGTGRADARVTIDALIATHADQLQRIAADEHPARFAALVAAESAGELAATEMTFAGLPWRAAVHDELLTGMLGPRPPAALAGPRPARPASLAAPTSAAGGRRPRAPAPPAPAAPRGA